MTNGQVRCFGKWSAICAALAVIAASGQACPPEMPGSATSLAGLWTGVIGGETTVTTIQDAPSPPNTNDQTLDQTGFTSSNLVIGFNDAGLPTTLPLAVSAFGSFFSSQPVTAFNAGEMQTISFSSNSTSPSGAMHAITSETTFTTTLTVTESVLTSDHFRVVYATTNITDQMTTFTDPAIDPQEFAQSSTGTLIVEATADGGVVMFSMDFNNNGTSVRTLSGNTSTGNGFAVGSLSGTLLPGTGVVPQQN
ncbi:MAG TPA: hypothetical protein VJZ71_16940 [Phycisphaerae bacterium]|nr:hypothetical protein [Phycisphaerae bacterium]